MATAVTKRIVVSLLLNMGSTSTGSIKTKALRLGGTSQNINTSAYNGNLGTSREKAISLAEALSRCISRSIAVLRETTEAELE